MVAMGTYTDTVHLYELDTLSGELSRRGHLTGIESPSFLASAPDGKTIYAVSEVGSSTGGAVVAIALAGNSMRIRNRVPSMGDAPCYLNVSKDGRWVVAANYTGGNFSVFSTNTDGSLNKAAQTINHPSPSHVHFTHFYKDDKYIWVNDLAQEKVYLYPFHSSTRQPIDTTEVISCELAPGSGPRHSAFAQLPSLDAVCVIGENSGAVSVIKVTGADSLPGMENIENEKPEFELDGEIVASADIHISPSGRYIYASHRGVENSITQYELHQDGQVSFVDKVSCMGRQPRNFMIDPTGRFLLVANQATGNVVSFAIDGESGKLTPTGHETKVEKVVCLLPIEEK